MCPIKSIYITFIKISNKFLYIFYTKSVYTCTFKCSVRAFTRALIEALNTAVEASFRPSTAARCNNTSCSLIVSRRNTMASANCFLLVFFSDSQSNKCFSNASHFAFNCLQNQRNKLINVINKDIKLLKYFFKLIINILDKFNDNNLNNSII